MSAPVCAEARSLIKHFEGLRLEPYRDAVGVPTIGYGATRGVDGGAVRMDHHRISEHEADDLLDRDLRIIRASVDRLVAVEIDPSQQGALVSFAFNLGAGALQASTLLRRINGRDWEDVPRQFGRWIFAGGRILPGLVRRRLAEAALWSRYLNP